MIEMFKMIYGIDKVNLRKRFCINEDKNKKTVCLKIRRNVNSNIKLKFFTRSY